MDIEAETKVEVEGEKVAVADGADKSEAYERSTSTIGQRKADPSISLVRTSAENKQSRGQEARCETQSLWSSGTRA